MIGAGRKTIASIDGSAEEATFYYFDAKVITELQPYGNLPFAVVGLKGRKLQVINLDDEFVLYQKELKFMTYTLQHSFNLAANDPATFPLRRLKRLRTRDKWMPFTAWKHRHCWVGDPMLLRLHCFFRLIREVPTGANTIQRGPGINFVDRRSATVQTTEDG
jgi:hypothetical protein